MPPSSKPKAVLPPSAPSGDFSASASYSKAAVQELRLLAQVFEHSALAMMLTDATPTILRVNRAFEVLTGYAEHEVQGRNPSLLRGSELREPEFYTEMWRHLREEGKWSGELVNMRRNGQRYPQHSSLSAIRNEDGEITHYIGQFYDITEQRAAEARIERLAYSDTLTGLPNRVLLTDRVHMALAQAQRQQHQCALLFVDLDGFKRINDTQGHEAGDRLLQEVAKRLERSVRSSDTVARLGGDEFVVLLANIRERNDAAQVANAITKRLSRPCLINGIDATVGSSIGIAIYPDDGVDFTTLKHHADVAMYDAKTNGGNRYVYFARAMNDRITARASLEQDLRRALQEEEFAIRWEPQIHLANGQLTGMQGRLVWPKARYGVASIDEFLPAAEAAGLGGPIFEWLLETVCAQRATWLQQGVPKIPVTLTLPHNVLCAPRFAVNARHIIAAHKLPTGTLELALPESALANSNEEALQMFAELSACGIHFALTGLAGGHTGLPLLRRLPFRRVYIERQIVARLDTEVGRAMVHAIVTMGHLLGLSAVADGVNNKQQLAQLRETECDEAQGACFPLSGTLAANFAWLTHLHS